MKKQFLVIPLVAINLMLSWTASAEVNDPQKAFESFKTQILTWTMTNANKMAASFKDNIVFEQPQLACKTTDQKSWFCTINELIGKGDHANYKISIQHPGSGVLYYSLSQKIIQLYDQYGNYSECEYQWLVDSRSYNGGVYFYLTNFETGRSLNRSTVFLPSIIFEAVKSPGQCEE